MDLRHGDAVGIDSCASFSAIRLLTLTLSSAEEEKEYGIICDGLELGALERARSEWMNFVPASLSSPFSGRG